MTVYIETYGCQMNKLDSENVAAILRGAGFSVVDDLHGADVVLLNTCGVRENAEVRIHGRVGELSSLQKERPGIVFGIIGCMAQRLGRDLLSRTVKVVAGPDSYRRLPDLIRAAGRRGAVDVALDAREIYEGIVPDRASPFSGWVAVTRGCDNFCSYCIVPMTRGRERSIPAERILADVGRLRDEGCREITLLGQNVNAWREGGRDFAGLLDAVADTEIGWVRFLTSHPRDLSERVFDVMARRENVCRHLHLPLQSGSDPVLRAMNRGYGVGWYEQLVEKARRAVPGLSVTTDLIFGFPGETEEDYRATIEVMERLRFDFAFLYRYSERGGTPACDLPNPVPEEERIDRLKRAIALQNGITAERNRERVGAVHHVLLKGPSKDGRGWYGFTDTNIPVVVNGGGDGAGPGRFVRVLAESSTGASLVGRCI